MSYSHSFCTDSHCLTLPHNVREFSLRRGVKRHIDPKYNCECKPLKKRIDKEMDQRPAPEWFTKGWCGWRKCLSRERCTHTRYKFPPEMKKIIHYDLAYNGVCINAEVQQHLIPDLAKIVTYYM